MATDYALQMKELAQEHVAEPVLAAGILQPAGTWGAAGIGQISGLAGTVMRMANNKKAGGLGKQGVFKFRQAIVAVSADKVYAFNANVAGRKWKIIEQVGAWDRKDLRVAMVDKKLTRAVTIEIVSTGERFELEATTIGTQGMNDPLFAELVHHT
jgi:hypothetical protein